MEGLRRWGSQAPRGRAYLHDDVKGQVEQQVADEDAQHVGGKVPGSVDESKEGTEHMGRNYFAAVKGDLVAFSLSHSHFVKEGNFLKLC